MHAVQTLPSLLYKGELLYVYETRRKSIIEDGHPVGRAEVGNVFDV